MKKVRAILVLFLAISLGFTACSKNEPSESNGSISFSITSLLKSTAANDSMKASAVVVTIVNQDNQAVVESKVIKLYSFNNSMVSEGLQLQCGQYKLTKFFVINSSDSIIYAAPISGSEKAMAVSKPLYIDFAIAANSSIQLSPEVLATNNTIPENFGYASFGYTVVDYLTFKTQSYAADTFGTYSPTSAYLTVKYLNSGESIVTTLGTQVNTVYLKSAPEYKLTFCKPGYPIISKLFTADSLKLFYNKPLKVYFTKGIDSTIITPQLILDSIPSIDSTKLTKVIKLRS